MSTRSTSPRIHVQRKSKPESFPVTLEEVKSFLRIENDQDDKLISDLIFMATDYAEWHMEKSLVKQTWQVSYEDYVPRRIYLSYGPVRSYIELFNYLNVTRADIVYEAGYDSVPEQIKLDSMFAIIRHINLVLKSIKGETILESNCAMDQHDEILHSTINFDILMKGGDNEQITAKN
uniref:Uncharacterized protein n=1 Tax=Glossina austeni TaxID=7395 RepID=A0A1A9VK03_GLOAU